MLNKTSLNQYYMLEIEWHLNGKSDTELEQETSRPFAVKMANLKLQIAKDYFTRRGVNYDSYICQKDDKTDMQIITVFSDEIDDYVVIRLYAQSDSDFN